MAAAEATRAVVEVELRLKLPSLLGLGGGVLVSTAPAGRLSPPRVTDGCAKAFSVVDVGELLRDLSVAPPKALPA